MFRCPTCSAKMYFDPYSKWVICSNIECGNKTSMPYAKENLTELDERSLRRQIHIGL